jgi:hypothetical protein
MYQTHQRVKAIRAFIRKYGEDQVNSQSIKGEYQDLYQSFFKYFLNIFDLAYLETGEVLTMKGIDTWKSESANEKPTNSAPPTGSTPTASDHPDSSGESSR